MNKLFLIPCLTIGLLLLFTLPLSAQNVVLSGRVTDATTGEPLIGVSVYNSQRRTGTTTNSSGYYSLTLPSQRQLELTFSYVGYSSETQTLTLTTDRQLNIQLKQGEYSLNEVQVLGTRHNFGAQSSQMSAIAVTAEQIRRMPVLFGETDVLKTLQHLPGVQSSGEGRAGIHVRGGDYDQNLFLLDGITLYNPQHLQGFTSAINADVLDDVVLYKGAFPARYGSRLSSIVDISLLDGDMERFRTSITAGMLASRVQVEGPIWKGHTSFNIAARASYFNAIVKPLLEEVMYDNPGQMNEFAHMKYYDINAKLVHRFSDNDKLSLVFYMGHDENNATPNETSQHFQYQENGENGIPIYGLIDNTITSQKLNKWSNLLGGLNYTHLFNESLTWNTSLSYSGYDYKLQHRQDSSARTSLGINTTIVDAAELYSLIIKQGGIFYTSKIHDVQLKSDLIYTRKDHHEVHGGIQAGIINLNPSVGVSNDNYTKMTDSEKTALNIGLGDERYQEKQKSTSNFVGNGQDLKLFGAYVEDDWVLTPWLKANIGIRLQGYVNDTKTQMAIEPRSSVRLMLAKSTSLKASYARMSQGINLLSSGSLLNPSEIWVPISGQMKIGTSDQVTLALNHDLKNGIQLSFEGYYKWLDNVMDYKEGASFQTGNNWEEKIAQGRGRAFGVELMAQKTIGHTTGMVSYTWSKSLRTFDQEGMILNDGREFYAVGDRRHNFSINITQRLSKNWDFSAAWTYQTGRRASLASMTIASGVLDEYNNYYPFEESAENPVFEYKTHGNYQNSYIAHITSTDTYGQLNAYVMPSVHRLDISLSHHGSVGIGEMICDIGIYNLYNHANVSSVYWGYKDNRRALMGVCLFPIMPSISLTLKL
ncbi:MAG: TonB-dependent receptor [Bacteroidaceae bacterium]|nr:TonB-dependent receptor [Bacteroidaceae bacterium]